MKLYSSLSFRALSSLTLCTGLLLGAACTKGKQASQQPGANPTMTDARPDLSNQPSPVDSAKDATLTPSANANPADVQGAVTTNPNSTRNTTDSTINTSAGAAVVGDANMNPANRGANSNVPTSVDNAAGKEPKTDAAVDNVNCRDAIANNYGGKTAAKTNDCPPTAESRIKDKDTAKDAPR